MTTDQILLFSLFGLILVMLLWGRFRHDLVAAGGLMIAVLLGLVPQDDAFSGFSNHAVVVVALVLVASRAFENSGALGLLASKVMKEGRSVPVHIAITSGLAAALSAVINNVAALAILMPLDIQAARKAGRPPSKTLMALAFATILGGMVTLIGTPPNIIAAAIRKEKLGEAFGMFAFTPVGLTVAIVGLLFVALIGWRLVPARGDAAASLLEPASFQADLQLPEESELLGKAVGSLEETARSNDVLLIGVWRKGSGNLLRGAWIVLQVGDVLVVEGASDAIGGFIKASGLQYIEKSDEKEENRQESRTKSATDATRDASTRQTAEAGEKPDDESRRKELAEAAPEILEAVVRADSRLAGRSARGVGLRDRFRVVLLGISRAGRISGGNVRSQIIQPGDTLLLTGQAARSTRTLEALGVIGINRVNVAPVQMTNVLLVVGLFIGALILATSGIVDFTIAIAIAVAAYAALGLVPAREFYAKIEWPVVVMLACLLPIGEAFDRVGGTALIAQHISALTQAYAPVVALTAMMIVTMTLSDVLNNVATMIITGPIAIDLAQKLHVNPDTFLMGVAISASCAFLTPIGHKNNTLIMGPGGFKFSDYWRMGLPLEIIVLLVSVPMLMIVFPLKP
ncbi:MAG: SLC13 family permease [Hyphomicrobiales bacterium]|nr:SLC13 family permease [Hyphomicrobiales bacterium]